MSWTERNNLDTRWIVAAIVALLWSASCFQLPRSLRAEDWPQLLGPNRNGISRETGLLQTWDKKGPPVLWEKEVGEGFSSPVVVGDAVLLFHRVGDNETLAVLDAASGKELWKFEYPCDYSDKYGSGNGPRSTPVVDGKHVYLLGASGIIHCLDLEKKSRIWSKSLEKEFTLRPSFFGFGSTPLVEGNRLVVHVGDKEAGIVAFDKATGEVRWKATDHEAGYSSPVSATVNDIRHLFAFTRQGLVSLNPENGEIRINKYWRSKQHASVNAANPVVVGDELFLSASYNTGACVLKISKEKVQELWASDEILSNQYLTSIYQDGVLFGFHGRHDGRDTELRCVDWKTGKVRWTNKNSPGGPMILADGNLILLSEDGQLVLLEANPDKYVEKARAEVLSKPCRAQLALSGGRLLARDNKKLICWNLKK